MRAAAGVTGLWPVLLGTVDDHSEHALHPEEWQLVDNTDRISVAPLLTRSQAQDLITWFRARAKSHDLFYDTKLAAKEPPPALAHQHRTCASATPVFRLKIDLYLPEQNVFTLPTETIYPPPEQPNKPFVLQPVSTIYLGLFPTQTPWHIPAFLLYGGINHCPTVEEQLIVWRWWYEQHQAEIVGVVATWIEAWVAAPPTNAATIERLAWEQELYCPNMHTLVGNVQEHLTGTSVWTFWWD